MTLDVHSLNVVLLAGAGVLLLAIMAVRLSVGVGFPSLLVYLLIGLALGDSGLGIHFQNVDLTEVLGFCALIVILAEGGLTTPWQGIRPVLRLGVALSVIGLGVSVAVVAVFAHVALGMTWQLAVLLGAVTSSTDAAAVFSVLRRVPLPRRLTGVLEAESGLNDAPVVVLVTLASESHHAGLGAAAALVVYELVAGVLIGVLLGYAGAWLLRRVALPSSGLYPLAILALTVVSYGGAALLHASGFAAVFLCALVLGNSELPHRAATRSFVEGLGWLAQIGLFVMLGLLASPGRFTLSTVVTALLAGLVLTFVARPLSVFASGTVQWLGWRELSFVSWAGLRGAVPIILATIPLAAGVKGATGLFDIVFVLVVLATLLTGPTLPGVARVLRVARRSEPRDLDVEAAPLERIAADLLQVAISPASQMHGVEVGELRLPRGASVTLVVREGRTIVPERRTVLRHGDEMLVVTPRRQREATEQRLRVVSRHGRLARWVGGADQR